VGEALHAAVDDVAALLHLGPVGLELVHAALLDALAQLLEVEDNVDRDSHAHAQLVAVRHLQELLMNSSTCARLLRAAVIDPVEMINSRSGLEAAFVYFSARHPA